MPYKIDTTNLPDYFEVQYFGVINKSDLKSCFVEAIELINVSGTKAVLTNIDGVTGGHNIFDLYEQIETYEKFDLKGKFKEALLMPKDMLSTENVKFYETACRNRGFNAKIFRQKEKAIEWILNKP